MSIWWIMPWPGQSLPPWPHAEIIDYPESFHEILMEQDHIRDDFLNNFYTLIQKTI